MDAFNKIWTKRICFMDKVGMFNDFDFIALTLIIYNRMISLFNKSIQKCKQKLEIYFSILIILPCITILKFCESF